MLVEHFEDMIGNDCARNDLTPFDPQMHIKIISHYTKFNCAHNDLTPFDPQMHLKIICYDLFFSMFNIQGEIILHQEEEYRQKHLETSLKTKRIRLDWHQRSKRPISFNLVFQKCSLFG